MTSSLDSLYSIINSYNNASDSSRAFTFIEFIKEFGYENSPNSFLEYYALYLQRWNKTKVNSSLNDKEFVRNSIIDTLKGIVLNYSSYEEQDFLANLDLNDKSQLKAILPFFAEKIKEVCELIKKKRSDAPYIIKRHEIKGTRKSLEQIIYDKILEFYFRNKNLAKSIETIKKDISISIEQYVDIYSDYFDVPRYTSFDDAERQRLINRYIHNPIREEYLSANINDIEYEYFLNTTKVLNDILIPSETRLEEIPLTAKMALDLSSNCAGDAAVLRDNLLYNATINQLSLNDQMGIRQRLYRKYLGCDLYYTYCDNEGNITTDILVRADNPSGNLLNCGTADMGVIDNNEVELLSNIGLFFHPDKMGILKVNIPDYTWEVDVDKVAPNNVYIFPDPNRYGNIGKNKKSDYPLLIQYDLSSFIRNISSGQAVNEPLILSGDTSSNTYFTRQDKDYLMMDNRNFDYSFTSLFNYGIFSKYSTDIFGNEYGLVVKYVEGVPGTITYPEKYPLPKIYKQEIETNNEYLCINGGYIIDPTSPERKPFAYNVEKDLIKDTYSWSGLCLIGGTFGSHKDLPTDEELKLNLATNGLFNESFKITGLIHEEGDESNSVPKSFIWDSYYRFVDYFNERGFDYSNNTSVIQSRTTQEAEFEQSSNDELSSMDKIKSAGGSLVFKHGSSYSSPIRNLETDIIINDFYTIFDKLIIESEKVIRFYQIPLIDTDSFEQLYEIDLEGCITYKMLYNDTDESLYLAKLYQGIGHLDLVISRYEIKSKIVESELINSRTDAQRKALEPTNTSESHHNFETFGDFNDKEISISFSYNNNFKKYLLSYIINNSTSDEMYLYNHIFKLRTKDDFYNTLSSTVYNNNLISTETNNG